MGQSEDTTIVSNIIPSIITKSASALRLKNLFLAKANRKKPSAEMDELYSYIKNKENQIRIWTAVDRNRLRFL
ncbi:MAG: hypothetical protein LBT24_00830 [Tannerella sp.]|nr:hypothetical protein [Tannerella sp.]